MNRADVINKHLKKVEEKGVGTITFTLKEGRTGVKYNATNYDVAEWVLNVINVAYGIMQEIELEEDVQLAIIDKWTDCIKDIVTEIYTKSQKND